MINFARQASRQTREVRSTVPSLTRIENPEIYNDNQRGHIRIPNNIQIINNIVPKLNLGSIFTLYDPQDRKRSNRSQNHWNLDKNSLTDFTFYPPEDIMNTELPKSLEQINDVQQMFLNYDRNNEEQTRKLVDFIENHVYTGLRELSTNIFLRPQKVKDYVHLYSLFSRNIKIISCHNFVCTPIFSHYLIKEGICSEFEATQLSSLLPNSANEHYLNLFSEFIKFSNCVNPDAKDIEFIDSFIDDNIDKFVELTSKTDFDYNEKLFKNRRPISLINLSAMYGAIKCFKYLLVHNPDLEIFVIMLLLVVTQKSSVFLNKQVLISMIHQLFHYTSVVMNYLTGFVQKQPKITTKKI
ncbi:hypothetical protein TVAG_384110 [Trichomonas vaginalis G3]|uniref:Uncharacterized protein n=1 Tax=Trichomonas vaginalis (strain ATCC PRA-98 / G3) TaxID=412133 RepID=A2F0B0_TRIV3|nr:ankycorbin family [Trichomonas vaginalis G3]EAY01672.1 hypothetical protein TVAG_384110 [Trichomonas vaginalis G3]KAI5515698.1 ankycorbin family [Trichomonas vaginalis G3]|eukprot:XP_001314265.1 hypothetical protein [Trichomonas vaginalis G3]